MLACVAGVEVADHLEGTLGVLQHAAVVGLLDAACKRNYSILLLAPTLTCLGQACEIALASAAPVGRGHDLKLHLHGGETVRQYVDVLLEPGLLDAGSNAPLEQDASECCL